MLWVDAAQKIKLPWVDELYYVSLVLIRLQKHSFMKLHGNVSTMYEHKHLCSDFDLKFCKQMLSNFHS